MQFRLLSAMLITVSLSTGVLCQNRIQIVIPTAEEESDYVWRTIQDISFFEQHNYQVSLPQGELIDALIAKSKANQLRQEDYTALENLMKSKVYQKADYQKAYKKIAEQQDLIHKMANRLSRSKRAWHFKAFDVYQIRLTLYGSGGSFDPENGVVTIFATAEGKFKQYDNPANTIIHEIVHIGIEDSIIQKYKAPHALKERIVDRFVLLNFKKYLLDYRVQNMGDVRIDQYLSKKKDLRKLNQIVERFMNRS